ncbi:hypothetical protein OC835_008009, partial [Tilletia horrida]
HQPGQAVPRESEQVHGQGIYRLRLQQGQARRTDQVAHQAQPRLRPPHRHQFGHGRARGPPQAARPQDVARRGRHRQGRRSEGRVCRRVWAAGICGRGAQVCRCRM